MSFEEMKPGQVIPGTGCTYTILSTIGDPGGSSIAYRAELTSNGCMQDVVVKQPVPPIGQNPEKVRAWLELLADRCLKEAAALKRLRGLEGVAEFVALEFLQIPVAPVGLHGMPIMVQAFINGETLGKYCATRWQNEYGEFSGIPEPKEFFVLARQLCLRLNRVHRRGVIHGDIWPNNILILQDKPVVIDFGEATFRTHPYPELRHNRKKKHYLAPERRNAGVGSWHIAADVYSLGGVMFFLATGWHPDPFLGDIEDLDQLKDTIVCIVNHRNPKLFTQGRGIANIIAGCLRKDEQERYTKIQQIVYDIDSFNQTPTAGAAVNRVAGWLTQIQGYTNRVPAGSLFEVLLDEHVRSLRHLQEDLEQKIYEIQGSHSTLASILTRYLSLLGKDDRYFTLTFPSLWNPLNFGVNGRVVDINHLLGTQGTIVRRVFLITDDDERNNETWARIVRAHKNLIADFDSQNISTDDKSLHGGGYYTGVMRVTTKMKVELEQRLYHFGYWERTISGDGKDPMFVLPIYRRDKSLSALRIYADQTMWEERREEFGRLLAQSENLRDYDIRRES